MRRHGSDEDDGALIVFTGGVTGTLSVRYLGLTPIDTPLRYEAWLDRSEGRKTFVKARLRTSPPADSTEASRVTAEAEGIFISVRTG